MARHDMFRWLAQKTERQTSVVANELDDSSGDAPDLSSDVVAPDGTLAPGLPAGVDVASNVNSAAIAVSAVAIALSTWTSGDSTSNAGLVSDVEATEPIEEVVVSANEHELEPQSPIDEPEIEVPVERMQPMDRQELEPQVQHQGDIPQDLESDAVVSSDVEKGPNPFSDAEPQLVFDTRRLRVVEALDKARKQPVPVCGMPVVELAPAVSKDGASFRAGYVVNVRAGGRKLSVRFEGSGAIPIFTLRLDGRYRLEGVPSHIAPRLVLDVEV